MTEKRLNHEASNARDDALLDELFAEARVSMPEPSPEFLARVMGDAYDVQAGFAPVSMPEPGAEAAGLGPSIAAALRSVFGGWAPMGGLLTAALAGLWIGFIGAEQMGTLNTSYWQTSDNLGTVNLLPSGDNLAFADEGGF